MPSAARPAPKRDHQARVSVSDTLWREFRAAVDNDSIASYLGRLVEQEVERYRARRVRDGQADDAELLTALERARELRDDLVALVAHLERRVSNPGVGGQTAGATWRQLHATPQDDV